MMLAGKGIIKRGISQVLRESGYGVKVLRLPWVRAASSAQSWVEDPSEARSALKAGCAGLYNDNRSALARRLRECMIPINESFSTTARWKRRVPRAVTTIVRQLSRDAMILPS